MRGVNDEAVADVLAVVPRPGVRAAVHRADAAGRTARLGPRVDGVGGGGPGAAVRALHAHAAVVGRAGECAGRAVPRRRRARHRGDHRERLRAVLRRLRPGPADRGRAGPQLPVRPARGRPARSVARGRLRRRARRPGPGRDVAQEARPRHRRPRLPPARPPDVSRSAADLPHRGVLSPFGGVFTTAFGPVDELPGSRPASARLVRWPRWNGSDGSDRQFPLGFRPSSTALPRSRADW